MQNSDTPNALINEASPYLLQHAYNPVQWVAWSQEAFERAKAEDKLVIISIGYSACHWCHVMAHESFEDVQVAKMMNDNFICIKVDREERPDVDQFYMDALMLMHSHGGWPLNAVSLPDGRPIYSGTYFTKNQWLGILADLAEGYKRNKAKSLAYAEKLMQGIHTLNLINPPEAEETFSIKLLKEAYLNFAYQYDRTHGGRGRAPKFPMPDNWLFLLRFHHLTQVEDAIPQVNLTLTKMAEGGIYDQIGGGFARYSVDPAWKVPHFEKMLYDNAQLMSVYAEAWQQTKNPLYKRTVYETADFLKRELLSPENGFYASLDADTEGEEGLFYVWRKAEIMDALGDAAPLAIAAFGIDQEAFWEKGNNVLLIAKSLGQLAESFQISEQEVSQRLDAIKTKLFEYRKQRVAPSLDDKIVLAWNALAVKGFVDAYKAFNDKAFFEQAKNTLAFIQENMVKEKQLYRTWKAEAKIPAFLDDYAYYIQALIEIYQVSFDITLLEEAKKMTDAVHEKFSVEDGVMYYYTDINYNEVASRKIDTADQVTASGNSVMANNLFKLGQFYEDQRLLNRSEKMLQYILPQLKDHLAYYSNWGILLCYFIKNYEVAIVGEKALEKRMLLENQFHPLKMVCGSIQGNDKLPLLADKYEEGKTMLYVCHDKRCELPTQDVEIALSQMK